MAITPKMTPAEYLAFEREQTNAKHEYLNGQVTAMGGASMAHSVIVGNVSASLHGQLRGRGCRVMSSDMRVHIPATGLYTYPDITVVCHVPMLQDDQFDTLLNPSVIIEVLSPSTEAYDRGEKFEHDRGIDSLQTYVLISQSRPHIEVYERQDNGAWMLTEISGLDSRIDIASIACVLDLSEVYELADSAG